MRLLEDDEHRNTGIAGIAAECSVSVGYFERLFRASVGMTPVEYRSIHRINMIKMYLHNERTTLEEIAERMGCCDSGYLCRLFKKKTGMTPKEYRRSLSRKRHGAPARKLKTPRYRHNLIPRVFRSILHLAGNYFDLRFLAASDFFLRLTLGFS